MIVSSYKIDMFLEDWNLIQGLMFLEAWNRL